MACSIFSYLYAILCLILAIYLIFLGRDTVKSVSNIWISYIQLKLRLLTILLKMAREKKYKYSSRLAREQLFNLLFIDNILPQLYLRKRTFHLYLLENLQNNG